MKKGRDICDVLKAIRKKIADAYGISYEPSECHYEGECSGTCPKCQSELSMLESVIDEKNKNGESVDLSGIAAEMIRNIHDMDHNLEHKVIRDELFHVYILVDGTNDDDNTIYHSLIYELLDAVRIAIDNNPNIAAKVECFNMSKESRWENINLEDVQFDFLRSGGVPSLRKGFNELGRKLDEETKFDYAPVIVLMSNGVSIENPQIELESLRYSQSFRNAIKIAFITSPGKQSIEILKQFTGSEEAVFTSKQKDVLKSIVKVFYVVSGPLRGDIVTEGVSYPNDGNDDWNNWDDWD